MGAQKNDQEGGEGGGGGFLFVLKMYKLSN